MLHPYLQNILSSGKVSDAAGNQYSLHSAISLEEGQFLGDLIRNNAVQHTLEIGFAYGVSSLFICDALAQQPNAHHTILDPNQTTQWHGVGIHGLRQIGFHNFDLIEAPSEIGLPDLLKQGKQFDLAFIDGWHTFDHTLLDFFYINRMLKVGGIVVIDDAGFPAVQRVARYISSYPAYEVAGAVDKASPKHASLARTVRRSILKGLQAGAKGLLTLVPAKRRSQIFSDALIHPAESVGIKGSMVAFRKIAEDDRSWDWYTPF